MPLCQAVQENKTHPQKIEASTDIQEYPLGSQFDRIVADKNREIVNSSLFRTIFQLQYPTWTYRSANPASHARRPYDILPLLRISPYINTHLAMGGAISTGDALSAIGSNAETGFKPLHQS